MKDFEFITLKEYTEIWHENHTKEEITDATNKLLNEKCQKGFTREHTSTVCLAINNVANHSLDTHEAFVFLREIEEEKECDHTKIREEVVRTSEGNHRFIMRECKFCPDCGKELK